MSVWTRFKLNVQHLNSGCFPKDDSENFCSLTKITCFRLEAILLNNQGQGKFSSTIEAAENLTRPRCIKSHLPLELLPRQIWVVKPKVKVTSVV